MNELPRRSPRLRAPATFEDMIASHLLDDAALATLFQEAALSDLEGRAASPVLHRWVAPVRIGLITPAAPAAHSILAVHAAYLHGASGHSISTADPQLGGEVNLGVLISGNPRQDLLETFWPSVASVFAGDRQVAADFARRAAQGAPARQEIHLRIDQGVIMGGVVAVPASLSNIEFYTSFWATCLRALGLMGRFTSYAQSVLAADGLALEPTALDRVLLALLYSPDLRPGVTRAAMQTALPAAVAKARIWGDFDALAPLAAGSR
ncbi:DUF2927 domain-containing protein [Falsiroseomonas sp.]|uniref:DUF2927 domain-containing protein n=1 Tax=Falsiroseomonas sp. TaxID=2870721 RepID=UPI003F72B360